VGAVVDSEPRRRSPEPRTSRGILGSLAADSGHPWTEALKLDLLLHLGAFPLAYLGNLLVTHLRSEPAPAFWHIWVRWDVPLYLGIARHGYAGPHSLPHTVAFFPFLPLSLRIFLRAGMSGAGAGLLVSGVALLVALAYLYRLASEVWPGTGRRALLYLCIFPMAVFLVAGYSESLFLAGAIPSFYYARHERWLVVAPFAAVSVGTRFAGIFVLLGLGVCFLQQRRFDARRIGQVTVAFVFALLPLVGFALFLWKAKGTPLAYFNAERLGWGRYFSWPLSSFFRTLHHHAVPTLNSRIWDAAWRVEIVAAAIGVVFTIWAIRRWELAWAAYMAGTLGTLMFSSLYFSIPRMLLSLFPIPMLLAQYSLNHPKTHPYIVVGMGASAAIGTIVFTHGTWFF
jgi:Mannosyltransferase (PIG-V)